MKTYIALFRGINVGGNNILPMKELASVLEGIGLTDVNTYIQSGNVVFQSKRTDAQGLARVIKAAIGKSHGFTPEVIILTKQALQEVLDANPFPEGESEPNKLHLGFLLSRTETPDLERLEEFCSESERFRLIDTVFYLHAPDGIGRSKLAAHIERAMGVRLTARNWRSVRKIMTMATDMSG